MANRVPLDVLQSLSQRLMDACQECATFRQEALYQAELARRAQDFNTEAQWRQQAEAWLIQAGHHAGAHDAIANVLRPLADA